MTRKLITGMKLSVDGKFEGPNGVADGGKPLFESNTRRRLELRKAQQLSDGRMSLVYCAR